MFYNIIYLLSGLNDAMNHPKNTILTVRFKGISQDSYCILKLYLQTFQQKKTKRS